MTTVKVVEKSVIDFVIVSSDLVKHIKHIQMDDKRTNVLTKNMKTKDGTIWIKWSKKITKVIDMFKFKDIDA